MKNPNLLVFLFFYFYFTLLHTSGLLLLLPLLMRLNGFDLIDVATLFRAITPLHPDWRTSMLIPVHLPTMVVRTRQLSLKVSVMTKNSHSVHQTIGGTFSFSTDNTLMLSLPTASGTRTTPSSIVFVSPLGDGAAIVLI